MGLILAAIFAAVNNVLAKKKGHNGLLWGFVSFLTYLFFSFAGALVLVLCCFKGDMLAFSQPESIQKVGAFLNDNILNLITVQAIGFGGFLLVYYIISRLKSIQNSNREKP